MPDKKEGIENNICYILNVWFFRIHNSSLAKSFWILCKLELCTFFFPFKILWLIKTEFLLTKLKFNTWLTSDESEEENQIEDYLMIQHQILQTNIMWIVWQIVRRITHKILGLKA